MLPPVLEIYVVWHPGDTRGSAICEELLEHFHGTLFSGLIGGAVEVYARSAGWRSGVDAPRPVPLNDQGWDGEAAQFVAVVPILGNEMAAAVQQNTDHWQRYLRALVEAQRVEPTRIGIFPYLLDGGAIDGTVLGEILSPFQRIAASPPARDETEASLRCRDLSQGIAQLLSPPKTRLTVFISHTKRHSEDEENLEELIATVRETIRETRLREFFDASDLQPGQDWDIELRTRAATSALLAIRTDLYSSREWCQREILIAKRQGMPLIIMDALGDVEERGSFLMDHVPRVRARFADRQWNKADVFRGLNLLVDESLKRALWRHQAKLAQGSLKLDIAWWAPHAPEPITLADWLEDERRAGRLRAEGEPLLVLHPDPPLGADEKAVLQQMLSIGGIQRQLDVMTPRLLAARSG